MLIAIIPLPPRAVWRFAMLLAPRFKRLDRRVADTPVRWRSLSPAHAAFGKRRPFPTLSARVETAGLTFGHELHLWSLHTALLKNTAALQWALRPFRALGPCRRNGLSAQIGGLSTPRRQTPFFAHDFAPDTELARKPWAELILQDGGFHFLDLARLQVAQHKWPEGYADQPVHRQAEMLQNAANLAIFAFADRDGNPDVIALLAPAMPRWGRNSPC